MVEGLEHVGLGQQHLHLGRRPLVGRHVVQEQHNVLELQLSADKGEKSLVRLVALSACGRAYACAHTGEGEGVP